MSPESHVGAVAPRAVPAEDAVFTNARLVLADAVVEGWLATSGGLIRAMGEGAGPAAAVDLGGGYLLPGLIALPYV